MRFNDGIKWLAHNTNYITIAGLVVFGQQFFALVSVVRGQDNARKSRNCI